MAPYIVKAEPIKGRRNWSPALSRLHSILQATSLQRTVCTQEQSRPQLHTWNSKPFVNFPAEITAPQSLHFQHLMWTEVIIQDAYSKEKPFVSNVYINI